MAKLNVVSVTLALLVWIQVGSTAGFRESLFGIRGDPIRLESAQRSFSAASATGLKTGSVRLEEGAAKPISRSGAALRSLIIPGWGESYLGYHDTARWFFWTDVAIWAAVIGLETYSQWKEDQFFAYAASHAGAQMRGKTDQFYADIGNYDTWEAYNEAKLRERNYDALYTSPSYYWAWDSSQNRKTYDEMRISSRRAHNNVYIFLGAAALNRLISFIDTGKKARDVMRRREAPSLGFHVQPELGEGDSAVSLVFSARF